MAENPRIEELRRRVQADPASIAFAALAEEFRRVGRYDESVETCRTGLQRHPAYLSARVTLGRALIETGDFDAAREELETVLRSAPENLAAIRGLAQIHEKLGHSTEMDPHLADMMNKMHAESIRVAALTTPWPPTTAPDTPPAAAPELSMAPEAEISMAPEEEISMAPQPEISMAPQAEFSMAPQAEFSMAPQAEIDPEPEADSMMPDAGPAAGADAPTDVFANFAQASKAKAAPDFSFDLGAVPALDQPLAAEAFVEPVPPALPALPALSSVEGSSVEGSRVEGSFVEGPFIEPLVQAAPVAVPDFSFDPEPEAEPVAAFEPAQKFEPVEDFEPAEAFEPVQAFQPAPALHVEAGPATPAARVVEGPDPGVLATLARLERFLDAIQSLRA